MPFDSAVILALMAQADTELRCFDAQSTNSPLGLLRYLINRCLGLRVLLENPHVGRCPLTTYNLLHLLGSSHAYTLHSIWTRLALLASPVHSNNLLIKEIKQR